MVTVPPLPRILHNFRFPVVVFGVEYLMGGYAFFLQLFTEILGSLNADRAH